MIRLRLEKGKYTVCIPEGPEDSGERFEALRYGKPWRDLCGDNLVFCLASDLYEARKKIVNLDYDLDEVRKMLGHVACDLFEARKKANNLDDELHESRKKIDNLDNDKR